MGLIMLVVGVVHLIREWTKPKDYTIRKVLLEYMVKDTDTDTDTDFWKNQKKNWDTLPDVFTVDVHKKVFLPLPKSVENPILKIVYVFNNREYIYTTRDIEYSWPPKKVTNMSFVLPLKNAVLMNSEEEPVKNITSQINQYAGPRFDFHGAPVPLTDMIDKPFTKLRVTNIMNQQSTLDLCS